MMRFRQENENRLETIYIGESRDYDSIDIVNIYEWRIKKMIIKDIDKGKAFDWGKTSKDYAKYRDIMVRKFWILEQEPVFFQEICISTELHGLELI